MATPSEKLAQSLEILKTLQDQGVVAILHRSCGQLSGRRWDHQGSL